MASFRKRGSGHWQAQVRKKGYPDKSFNTRAAVSGYPPEMTINALRNSNGIVFLAAQLASILSDGPRSINIVSKMKDDFADCLPTIDPRQDSNT